jgi:hypothetical protein
MAEWFVAKAAEMSDGDRRIVNAGRHEIGVFCKDGALCRVRSGDAAAYLLSSCMAAFADCGYAAALAMGGHGPTRDSRTAAKHALNSITSTARC